MAGVGERLCGFTLMPMGECPPREGRRLLMRGRRPSWPVLPVLTGLGDTDLIYDGARGVLVRSVLGAGEELSHGNELLAGAFADYDVNTSRKNPLYTVENIRKALENAEPSEPDRWDSAFDQLAGYLVLDALVAGRDRHHENWAVMVSMDGGRRLAPSFDHGNALGFAEPVERAEALISDSSRLQSWLRKGTSHHFAGRPGLVEVARRALSLCTIRSRQRILDSVRAFDLHELRTATEHLPQQIMSEPHRRLAVRIVEENRRRLFDALHS